MSSKRFVDQIIARSERGADRYSATDPSERDFQAAVVELAEWQGWLVYHTFDARRSAKGFPDLVAVHGQTGELLFAELKTARGRVSPDQRAWLRTLELAADGKPGVTVKLWRPADWPDVEATLARRSR